MISYIFLNQHEWEVKHFAFCDYLCRVLIFLVMCLCRSLFIFSFFALSHILKGLQLVVFYFYVFPNSNMTLFIFIRFSMSLLQYIFIHTIAYLSCLFVCFLLSMCPLSPCLCLSVRAGDSDIAALAVIHQCLCV